MFTRFPGENPAVWYMVYAPVNFSHFIHIKLNPRWKCSDFLIEKVFFMFTRIPGENPAVYWYICSMLRLNFLTSYTYKTQPRWKCSDFLI